MTTNPYNVRPHVNVTVVNAREDENYQKDIRLKLKNPAYFKNLRFKHSYNGPLVEDGQVVVVSRTTVENMAVSGHQGADLTKISQIPVIGILNGITAENAYSIMKNYCPLGVSLSRSKASLADGSTTTAVHGPKTVENNGDKVIPAMSRVMVTIADFDNPKVRPTAHHPNDGPQGRIPFVFEPVDLKTVGNLNKRIITGAMNAKAAYDANQATTPPPSAYDQGVLAFFDECMRYIEDYKRNPNPSEDDKIELLALLSSRYTIFQNVLRDWTIGYALSSAMPGQSFDLFIDRI